MDLLSTRKYSKNKQYLISVLLITVTAILCFFSVDIIGYRAVALILLLGVSVNAILFDIFPVMLSALLSALIWNFFFIPPIFTLQIETAEDALMFLMYFVIAFINAVLTYKIRKFERKEREQHEKEKSIKLYNTILNSLSHELRTPISTIIGAIDTIKDNQIKLSKTNRDELYTEIETAGFRLNRQVENLLSMSRLEAGFIQSKTDWCDFNELVFSAIKHNKNNAQHHEIIFAPKENFPLVKIDSGLTEQILFNLIHNALQHTPKNTKITIQLDYNLTHCFIEVSDNGTGFPENEIKHVFDKFYRLNKTATGGTGLGLSIVKGFTEAMNGKVFLNNLKTGGAKFTIKIPCEFSESINLKNE
ncbi:two-component system sensor histidine kinase KdpD [Mesonia hippocampi]|uniref:histidine kinase n=1 Tax=Mesonia hippocampi TaxID=1628250 RepID=A0A840ER32_9FLAO|nr:ATP-binding protein [Mesonia hippocampi]MBB4119515.1 two-component system sensor histidine kinase KdpD [Mesonia hippocampi]